MRSAIANVVERFVHIESYIDSISLLNKLAGYKPKQNESKEIKQLYAAIEAQNSSLRRKKTYEYSAIVVSIYGALESFIESLISVYVQSINLAIRDYNNIPDAIKNNHFQLSAQLIKNLSRAKYRSLTTKETVILNLHSCIVNSGYKINHYAYIEHSSNFRHETVLASFKNIGVDDLSNKIISTTNFSNHIKDKYSIVSVAGIKTETLFAPLENLAQRRNEIAHGQTFQLLDHSYLLEILSFTKEYCIALFYVLRQEYLKLVCEFQNKSVIAPVKVFNRRIVCFHAVSGAVSIDDKVVCQSTSGMLYVANIISIHVNNHPVLGHVWSSSQTVCILIDVNVKDNYTLFLIDNKLVTAIEYP